MIKIVSANIEGARHLDLIRGILETNNPEVIFLQEAFEADVQLFAKHFDMHSVHVPMVTRARNGNDGREMMPWGLAVLTKYPVVQTETAFYSGSRNYLPEYVGIDVPVTRRALLSVKIQKGAIFYYLINTHFTWTPDGKPTPDQMEDLDKMLVLLEERDDFILCGDFNAPRGREVWTKLSSIYKDNIPENVSTTVDKNKHRAGDLQLVVDGLFTTPHYDVKSLEVIDGVSDHCAIAAEIEKV